jgi:hypothetical protein
MSPETKYWMLILRLRLLLRRCTFSTSRRSIIRSMVYGIINALLAERPGPGLLRAQLMFYLQIKAIIICESVSPTLPSFLRIARYLAAGRSPDEGYDDMWILSLPQFVWTQVFLGVRPNYGASCHYVGHKQMLILGGTDGLPIDCHQAPYVSIFDMTNLKWLRGYDPNDKDYRVPKAVWEWIGGS